MRLSTMNTLGSRSVGFIRRSSVDKTFRQLHATSGLPYQVNSEHFREGGGHGSGSPLPNTVAANVKNVVGWRGGAERGFLAAYSDCIHVIRTEGARVLTPDLTGKYMKIFTSTLSSDFLGARFGILVPVTYRQLTPKATKEEMQLAHVLGWGVEFVRAGSILADRVTNRPHLVPKGSSEGSSIGMSTEDVLALDGGVFVLLKHTFQHLSATRYANYITAILEAQQNAVMARTLHLNLNTLGNGSRLSGYEIETYKKLVRNSISHMNYCLPVSLALYKADITDSQIHSRAHAILNEISYFMHVSRDFMNCYVDPHGNDIAEGRISWLIVLAKQRANSSQLSTLSECYGHPEPEKIAEVKKIYQDLNLKKISNTHINGMREDIHKQIQQISKLNQIGLTQDFFFKLIDNMTKN